MAGFVDDMVAALSEQLRRERAELARSSHARRFEVVSLILDSAPITTGRASTRLGYDLRRRHTAAVLWTDPRRPDQAALAGAAEALGPATRARQVLTVIASSSSVWAWLAAAADTDAGAITAATAAHPAVRVAVGPAGSGVDGFRRSHFDAVATQRLMSRRPDLRVARFADVQLVTLALQDEQRAREFVARTLGDAGRRRGRTARHAVRVHRRAVQRRTRRPGPVHPPQHGPQPPPARRTAAPVPAGRPRPRGRRRARDRPVAGDATRQCHPCQVTCGHPDGGSLRPNTHDPSARAREPGSHVTSSASAGDFGGHVADRARSRLAMSHRLDCA